MKRQLDSYVIKRMLLALFIATVIFLDIFFVANFFSYLNEKSIENRNNVILDALDTAKLRLDNFVCDTNLLIESSQDLDNTGFKISILELRFGKDDSRVLEKKKLYSELELSHFNLIKKFNKECNSGFNTLLFFYSNREDLLDESENVGFILSSYKKEDPTKTMIYSFDYYLDYFIVNELKTRYNVTSPLSVVVNEDEILFPRNIDDLKNAI